MKHKHLPFLLSAGMICMASFSQAATIFEQDFSYGGVTADYEIGGAATGSLFTDIGTNSPGTATITSNQMVLGIPQVATVANVAGWGVTGLTAISGDIMSFTVDLRFDITSGGDYGPMANLTFGDYNGTYSTYPHPNEKFTSIGLRRNGSSQIKVEPINGTSFTVNYGVTNTLTVFMNDTGVAQTYVGPDGSTYNLSITDLGSYVQGSYAVWIGNTIMGNDLDATTYSGKLGKTLDTIMMSFETDVDTGITATLDNFEVSSIPEPSTLILSLLAMGSVLLLKRRK